MELIRFLMGTLAEWVRDTVVNLSGRIVEQSLGDRARRRRRKRRRKPTRSP
jgi:hypothetical protein